MKQSNVSKLKQKSKKYIKHSVRILSAECVIHSVSLYVQSEKCLVCVVVPSFTIGNAAKKQSTTPAFGISISFFRSSSSSAVKFSSELYRSKM